MRNRPVLIDTSVWILALRKQSVAAVQRRVETLLNENMAVMTPAVFLELLGGAKSEREFSRLKSRLESLPWAPFGKKEWDEAALLAFRLRGSGKPLPYIDILIGAVAMVHDLVVLHADKHFDVMSQEVPLEVESMVSLVKEY